MVVTLQHICVDESCGRKYGVSSYSAVKVCISIETILDACCTWVDYDNDND